MENTLSLSDLLFPNQYRRKVLALLMMNPHKWVHLRELARMNTSPTAFSNSASTKPKPLSPLQKKSGFDR
jgi:hypothetical protein